MNTSALIMLAQIIAAAAVAQTNAEVLAVGGSVAQPLALTLSDLQALPRVQLKIREKDGAEAVYEGVALYELVSRAKPRFSEHCCSNVVNTMVVARASDNYQAAFAMSELDPKFSGRKILLADRRNGRPLDSRAGPLEIIVPDEKARARWVRQVKYIDVIMIGDLREGGQTAAASAEDFLSSIGVCAHLAQGVDHPKEVAGCLRYAGIRGVRDDASANPATIQGWIGIHQSCGAKMCLLPINGNIAGSLSMYEKLAAAGALLAAEGPNEPNNSRVNYNGEKSSAKSSLPVARFQADLYKAVKADPILEGIPVFASSEAGGSQPDNCGLQFLTIPNGAGTLMPDGSIFGDYANTHNYVCDHLSGPIGNNAWDAEDPSLNGRWDGMYVEYGRTWWSPGYNGYSSNQLWTLPRVTTETGWTTRGSNSISEIQQAKLFLNLYLAAFKRGWRYTFIYMLRDDPVQGYWGLFNTDYSPKPSAIYLHNLTGILSGGGSGAAGSLAFSIPDEPATVHDLLLQKGGGAFELAVWGEMANGSANVTVKFPSAHRMLRVYDPAAGTSAQQTLRDADSVLLTLSDHPLIVEIPGP